MELLKDDLLPGDCIIITAKNTWFRRLVAWFTQTPRESKTVAVHICGVSSNKTIIESLVKVVERVLKDWMKGRTEFEIWRNKKWTYEQRQKISDELYDYMGRFYGFWKLFFHGFDFL